MDKSMLGDLDSLPEEDKVRMSTMIDQLQIRDRIMPPRRRGRGRGSNRGGGDVPPAPLDGTEFMRQMVTVMTQIARDVKQEVVQQQQEPGIRAAIRDYNRLSPPQFDGRTGAVAAENWLEETTRLLEVLDIRDDVFRVRIASLKLIGYAGVWWTSIKETHDIEQMQWEQFRTLFLTHFFPEATRDALREEFIWLTQREMSVVDYQVRFTSLARFAPEMVSTGLLKAKRFIRGLKPSIRSRLSPFQLETYELAFEKALLVEEEMQDSKKILEVKSQSKSTSSDSFGRKRSRESVDCYQGQQAQRFVSSSSGGSFRTLTLCYQCGQPGHHRAECPQRSLALLVAPSSGDRRGCYSCGQLGHICKDFPHRRRASGDGSTSGQPQQQRQQYPQ